MATIRSNPAVLRALIVLCLPPIIALVLASGCAKEGEDPPPQGKLEIIGNYTDEFASDHQITEDTWTSFGGLSVVHIEVYSNALNFLAGRNDVVNSFDPGKYSRYDWVMFNGHLYYCTTAYDADSLNGALLGTTDASDPTAGGCNAKNDFPWTDLTP